MITVNKRPDDEWVVGMSACLPSNLELARLYAECMSLALEATDGEDAAERYAREQMASANSGTDSINENRLRMRAGTKRTAT